MTMRVSPRDQYREVTHSQVIDGFTVTEATYAPNLKVARHSHPLACFGLVLHGTYIENYGKKALECKPLHLKFRPAGEVHADSYGDPAVRCFFIELEAEWLEGMRKRSVTLAEPSMFYSDSLVYLVMKIRREAQRMDELSQLAVEGLMLEIIAEATRHAGTGTEHQYPLWLKQAREILHDRFSERLTLMDIGASVGVHPVHLAVVFRRRHGYSVGEYLRKLRIEFACREISTTDAPLAQIALAAGFAHQSQFSRTFKRLTGLTPARYRSITRT